MTHAIPLATLRGIAAMAPRRLRREIKIAIKQIERAFRPVFVSCVEAPAEHGRLVSPDDLEAICTRLQNIHETGLTVMRADAEAIANLLGLSWEVAAPSLTPTEVEADKNAADGRAQAFTKDLRFDPTAYAMREGITRCLSPDDQTAMREALDSIESILGKRTAAGVLPPSSVIITEHPQPHVDPLIYHRILDEVATTIGRERTEAMRAELPPRS